MVNDLEFEILLESSCLDDQYYVERSNRSIHPSYILDYNINSVDAQKVIKKIEDNLKSRNLSPKEYKEEYEKKMKAYEKLIENKNKHNAVEYRLSKAITDNRDEYRGKTGNPNARNYSREDFDNLGHSSMYRDKNGKESRRLYHGVNYGVKMHNPDTKTKSQENGKKHLSTGTKVGIGLGVGAATVGAGYGIHRFRKNKREEEIERLKDRRYRKEHPELVKKYHDELVKRRIILEGNMNDLITYSDIY